VQVLFDSQEKHSGKRSLRVSFDGSSDISFYDVCQTVPVQGGTAYELSGWMETKALTTDQECESTLRTAGSTGAYTADARGTQPWTRFDATWEGVKNDQEAEICLRRDPSDQEDNKIRGTVLVDDIALTPVAQNGGKEWRQEWREEMTYLRFAICALVAFGVLAHGGVEDWARACFEIGGALLFLAWAVWLFLHNEETIVISPLLPPLVAFYTGGPGTIAVFHHGIDLQHPHGIHPIARRCAGCFVAVQAFRTLEDWRGFVWFVMIFGFLVSVFGILQHLTFNGKLYWFREMHYGGIPFGPYVNRNHFAGFAELFIPMALVPLMLGKVRRERLIIVGLFAVVSIGSLFLAASREALSVFSWKYSSSSCG